MGFDWPRARVIKRISTPGHVPWPHPAPNAGALPTFSRCPAIRSSSDSAPPSSPRQTPPPVEPSQQAYRIIDAPSTTAAHHHPKPIFLGGYPTQLVGAGGDVLGHIGTAADLLKRVDQNLLHMAVLHPFVQRSTATSGPPPGPPPGPPIGCAAPERIPGTSPPHPAARSAASIYAAPLEPSSETPSKARSGLPWQPLQVSFFKCFPSTLVHVFDLFGKETAMTTPLLKACFPY